MNVTLTADEGMAAASAGCLQMMRAIAKGWVGNDHGGVSGRDLRERWAQAIHGALAEYAFCKAMDKCWTPSAAGITGQDATGWQVRATPWDGGHLILNKGEPEKWGASRIALVTGHWPTFKVVGWIAAQDAAKPEWFRENERPASFWVPQSALRPMSEAASA